jgi:hypothetical protein
MVGEYEKFRTEKNNGQDFGGIIFSKETTWKI